MKRDYEKLLEKYYSEENEKEKQLLEQELYKEYGTDEKCFRCGNRLLVSDLKQYKYLCLSCDENMYEFEISNTENLKEKKDNEQIRKFDCD